MNETGPLHERIVDNHGVGIHTLIGGGADEALPMVVVPGMLERAEYYAGIMADRMEGRTIFLSIRGRGKSGAPSVGYSFEEQISDIGAVISELANGAVCLLGHSVGAAFALGYALKHPGRIAGLILSDHPPYYPRFSDGWVARALANPYRTSPEHAIRSIAGESKLRDMSGDLAAIGCPVLITHGGAEGSLLREEYIEAYRSHLHDPIIAMLPDAGHNPFLPDEGPFLDLVASFIKRIRNQSGTAHERSPG